MLKDQDALSGNRKVMEGKRSSLRNSADKITEVTVTVVTVSL